MAKVKVDGIDPVVLQKIEAGVKRDVISEIEKTKVEGGKKKAFPGREEYKKELLRSTRQLNLAANAFNFGLRFKLDREENEIYVLVIDREKGEVVRRIPPENVINLAAQMEYFLGLLLDTFV